MEREPISKQAVNYLLGFISTYKIQQFSTKIRDGHSSLPIVSLEFGLYII